MTRSDSGDSVGGGVNSGGYGHEMAGKDVLHLAESSDVGVDEYDLSPEAEGHLGGVGTHHAGADYGHGARGTPGTPASNLPMPPCCFSR